MLQIHFGVHSREDAKEDGKDAAEDRWIPTSAKRRQIWGTCDENAARFETRGAGREVGSHICQKKADMGYP
jgi:hypothetical protein